MTPMAEMLHREHLTRRGKWKDRAVPDDGIDLRRAPRHVILRPVLLRSDGLAFVPPPPRPEPITIQITTDATPQIVPVQRIEAPKPPLQLPWTQRRKRRLFGRIVVKQLIERVAADHGIEPAAIRSGVRTQRFVVPRHIAMYLAHIICGRSLTWIGEEFGGRDHTTILHAIANIKKRMLRDVQFAAYVTSIECVIRARNP